MALMTGCGSAADITGPALEQETVTPPSSTTTSTLGTSAFGDQTNEQDVPWVYSGPNPCNGDAITLDGKSHVVMHTYFDATGSFHLSVHFFSKGSGIGASMKEYEGKSEDQMSVQVPDPTATQSFQQIMLVRGPERLDDFFLHIHTKLTINANGKPTAAFDRIETRCK